MRGMTREKSALTFFFSPRALTPLPHFLPPSSDVIASADAIAGMASDAEAVVSLTSRLTTGIAALSAVLLHALDQAAGGDH